jgi:hypothetical protein
LSLSGAVVTGCVLQGNHAVRTGGGIGTRFSQGVTITDCVITGNVAEVSAGGVAFDSYSPFDLLVGCTITSNRAELVGGGVTSGQHVYLDRSILGGNCASGDGKDLYVGVGSQGAALTCCDVDSLGVFSTYGTIEYDPNCVFTDPQFCAPADCGQTIEGDWAVDAESPCVAANSPCGHQIGALGPGCNLPPPTPGACCLADGSCLVIEADLCQQQQGEFMGEGTVCSPNLCGPTPTMTTSWGRIKAGYR